MCKGLEAKHARWQGVSKTDFKVTTALVRSMDSPQYGRTALMRLLSNAHATPHRLYRQNIVPTPACRYCSCPDADVEHIAYHCPRFEFLRKDWPAVLSEYSSWPNVLNSV